MKPDDWRNMLTLHEGEELRHDNFRTTGFMLEEDIDTYSIIGLDGKKTGEVTVRDHTAVKGFRRTIRVIQADSVGRVVFETSYVVSP